MHDYLALLATLGFLGGVMWAMMKFMLRDIHKDLLDIKQAQEKSDQKFDHLSKRIDHLYQICIEMLGTKHKH